MLPRGAHAELTRTAKDPDGTSILLNHANVPYDARMRLFDTHQSF